MAISKMCAELLRAKAKQVLPPQPSLWDSWLTSQLDASTLCLQRLRAVIPAVKALLRDMASSTVLEHFKALLLWADHRGSDVQLRTGMVLDGSAQVAPYPAFASCWSAVQQCHWRAERHNNKLELTALFDYLRTGTWALQDVRLFHIFDSQVAAAVAAKGRSSSRVLTRVCRHRAADSLSSNAIVISLWALSGWQHSDAASRLCQNTQPFSWCHQALSQIHGCAEHHTRGLRFGGGTLLGVV